MNEREAGGLARSGLDSLNDSKECSPPRRTFLGHPRGLAVLFFAEMWERFSFYGMRALLVLYLTQYLLYSDSKSQGFYASYVSLVYLMPLFGGFVADRYLGPRKAVLIGAVFLTAGHFTMAFEGDGAHEDLIRGGRTWNIATEGRGEDRKLFAVEGESRQPLVFSKNGVVIGGENGAPPIVLPRSEYEVVTHRDSRGEQAFFLAMSLIVIGVGFLKSNISTLVGALYARDDPERDSGFTIFYVGINFGSLIATGLCGWIGLTYGWRYGFGLAGIGMLMGLLTFIRGTPLLEGHGEPPRPLPKAWELCTWAGALLMLIPVWWLVQHDQTSKTLLFILAPVAFFGLLVFSLVAYRGADRRRMVVAIVLIIFSIVYRMLFDQAGSSMTLYAARISDLHVFGDLKMTAAQTGSFNPFLIVLLAPFFAWLWKRLAMNGRNPSIPVKFAVGIGLAGLGFVVLACGASHFVSEIVRDGEVRLSVPLVWLFLAYLFHTVGEIFLSPVGLSMITKLSPPRIVGLMMGFWYLSASLANTIGGEVAKLTSVATVGGVATDPRMQLDVYVSVFMRIGLVGLGTAALLLLLAPLLKRGLAGPA